MLKRSDKRSRGLNGVLIKGLTPEQEMFVDYYIQYGSVKRVRMNWPGGIDKAPVNTTIYRWMRDPRVVAILTREHHKLGLTGGLVGTRYCIGVVEDGNEATVDRLRAAVALIQQSRGLMDQAIKVEDTNEARMQLREIKEQIQGLIVELGPSVKQFIPTHLDKKEALEVEFEDG